jgi:hypothetical protein
MFLRCFAAVSNTGFTSNSSNLSVSDDEQSGVCCFCLNSSSLFVYSYSCAGMISPGQLFFHLDLTDQIMEIRGRPDIRDGCIGNEPDDICFDMGKRYFVYFFIQHLNELFLCQYL